MSRFSKFLMGAVAMVGLASASQAATVTFVLSIDDNGTGAAGVPVAAPGHFAVYAEASSGDNLGLAAYAAYITGMTTVEADSPYGVYKAKTSPLANVGWTGSNGATINGSPSGLAGKITATQDTTDSPTGYLVMGFGQADGTINTVPTGYKAYADTQDTLNPDDVGAYYAKFLIADGTYTAGTYPAWATNVADAPGANVFTLGTSGGVLSTIPAGSVAQATVVTQVVGGAPIPEPASLGVLALGGLALLARRRK